MVEVEARRASERVVSSRSMAVDNCVALRPPVPLASALPSSLVLVVVVVLVLVMLLLLAVARRY